MATRDDQPETSPPAWLSQWPKHADIQAMFPAGIRQYAYRLIARETHVDLTWTDSTLVLRMGDQKTVWRLLGAAWRRTCTCGYRTDCCIHAYAAACLLHDFGRRHGWAAAARPASAPGRQHDGGAPAGVPEHRRERAAAPSAGAGAGVGTDAMARSGKRLEVEADFHHEPDRVLLRFYANTNDQRRLMRLQEVFNLGVRFRGNAPIGGFWPAADGRFLAWLAARLGSAAEMRRNMQVLKLGRDEFASWVAEWAATPGRFIDRAGQAPILAAGSHSAGLAVELRDCGEWIEIAALIVTPAGRRLHVHEVFDSLASGRRDLVLAGELVTIDPPLSWELLGEVFAKRPPRMRRMHICAHLGPLLEGRLDLVEGDIVRRETIEAEVGITATADGADVLLAATVGPLPVACDKRPIPGGMRADGTGFVITVHDSPALAALRTGLDALAPTPAGQNRLRVAGTHRDIAKLVEFWQRLPPAVVRRVAPELERLLGGTADLKAEIMLRDAGRFLDVSVAWSAGGKAVSADELRAARRSADGLLRTTAGTWLHIDPARAAQVQAQLAEAGFAGNDAQRLFPDGARRCVTQLIGQAGCDVAATCRTFAERLLHDAPAAALELSPALATVMRPYQRQGFEFLADRSAYRIGAILADDMGLGKTLQVLALIASALTGANRARTLADGRVGALVVCPASVVDVWLEQAQQFCPDLRCAAYTGASASRAHTLRSDAWDVLVANYALVRLDAERFLAHEFAFVVLDEAQQIKNPDSQIAHVVKKLRTPQPLALTGTPLENRVLDLWSIADFVNTGYLGTREAFLAHFEGPGKERELARRLAPMLLRRTKAAVAPELPPRTEEVLHVAMTDMQRAIYDRELLRARTILRERGPVEILAALTRLRQVCCHPELVQPNAGRNESGKLATFLELAEEILAEGHSLLVFSQFTRMLDVLDAALREIGVEPFMLTGQTPTARRAALVREFNEAPGSRVFLLSLKAAGTGLTLTKADYVVLFDPWWNPAVERQAIDRTHRIGQDKPVIAYRLVAAGSVEEKVLALQAQKAELFAQVVGDAEEAAVPTRLSREDLEALLA